MWESFASQFWSIIDKHTNKVSFSSSLKHGHSQTESYIFDTGHITGSLATTCKMQSPYYSIKMNITVPNMCADMSIDNQTISMW